MRALGVCLLLTAAASISRAAPSPAGVTVQQDKSCGVAIVAVDGHTLKSPQQKISVAPGHHILLLRISPARYPGFSDDVTLDETFEANGRYTVMGLFYPSKGQLSIRFIDDKKRSHSK
jgi:hypothetical protein